MTKEYHSEYQANNTEALHAELQAAFGERYLSMDSSDDGLVFRFSDEQPNDKKTIAAVLDGHDPTVRTARQNKADDKRNAYGRLHELDVDALRTQAANPDELRQVVLSVLDILEDFQKLLYEG